MVKWHDPLVMGHDFLALSKLWHAFGALYIWDLIFTANFEYNILRGKLHYSWANWIYLGTRYTCLLGWIFFFINNDTLGLRLPCVPMLSTNIALMYASWTFASFLIVLRVIAIWKRDIVVSSIAVVTWMIGVTCNILAITLVEITYDSFDGTCAIEKTHRDLFSVVGIMVVDTVLLMLMLTGLRRDAHEASMGIWHLLYNQCIIWIFFAAIAEIPLVVFMILNFNDPWNDMFTAITITILSLCAARMYRALYLDNNQGYSSGFSSEP